MKITRCYSQIILCLLLFLMFIENKSDAANYVKIATIGTSSPSLDTSRGMNNVVVGVINFWKKELNQVLSDKPDLIVLPELCDCPKGLNQKEQSKYYLARKNQIQDFFASIAIEYRCYIAFGTKRELENGTWLNSIIILDRHGSVAGIYDKNFPTIDELGSGIIAGNKSPVFKCDFGTVACAICFDLNFTELMQEYVSQKPDIILFSSMYHGGLMQASWAYTCRSFFAGAISNKNVPSEIRNPQGETLAQSTNYFDFTVKTINLDYCLAHLDYNWEKLRKLKEKYGNDVTIMDPGKLGSVLITSGHQSISAVDMVKEFDIELLDDYLNRSRLFRNK